MIWPFRTKLLTLPTCATCDLAVEANQQTVWCHGAPPTVFSEKVVTNVSGTPTPDHSYWSAFPPISKTAFGCAMHPLLRKKLGRGQ